MFPEMYAAYNSQFYSAMINGMSINASFENLTNTAFWEQYIVNSFQFSGAKNLAEMKELQSLVFDENKVKRSFSEFQKLALPRLEKYQQYLRVEYDLAVRGAVLAEQWQDIWRDRDINPYAIYKTREDNRVRDEHRILDNICFLIDSPEASMIYPPSDWNCRCYWDTDSEKNSLYKTRDELKALIKDNIPVEFQRNVGTDGIMPSPKYFYKDALSNANDAQYSMFASNIELVKLNTAYYSEYQIQSAINEWMQLTPDPKDKDIIFRNHDYKLNIRLTANSFDKIKNNRKGFENIRHTIEHPTEIWARWINPETQKDVHLNWILISDRYFYLVQSEKGFIIDARLYKYNVLNNYRTGIKFLK
jgi:hypothetical protein